MNSLSDTERLNWLRLIRTENVGPITFFRLLERFGSATKAIENLPHLAKRGGRQKPLSVTPLANAEKEMTALKKLGGRHVFAGDADYPKALLTVEDRPPVITVLGHLHLLQKPALAIVGARNASLNGRKFAEKLARDLGAHGFTIVSGLARGIDTAAHAASLETGTAAILGGGIDIVYPQENQALYNEIKERGILVAENAPGYPPQARDFPRRNRIISGLSQGVIIVEAALKSGSLITATYALEQGRDVFAVPGSPLDPRSQGTNKLLKEGAILIESAADILQELVKTTSSLKEASPADFAPPAPAIPSDEDIDHARGLIITALGPNPAGLDELIRACQVSAPIALSVLLELELAGRLQRLPGNQIALLMEG